MKHRYQVEAKDAEELHAERLAKEIKYFGLTPVKIRKSLIYLVREAKGAERKRILCGLRAIA